WRGGGRVRRLSVAAAAGVGVFEYRRGGGGGGWGGGGRGGRAPPPFHPLYKYSPIFLASPVALL
ncbi:hypothetical protein ACDX36_21405, partial [Pseudomonas aeruginosa]|uniref:hypothetical protein n=1 Tax=Pseudomonas aeruginosa TaxID=287 RepID=UPI0039C1FCC2